MRRSLIPLTSSLLAAMAWAQEPVTPAGNSAAAMAAKAMAAMDALAPAASATAPKVAKSGKSAKAGKGDPTENEETTPPLLPGPASDPAQGMDLLSRTRLDMLMPAGRSHRGVHYPMYRKILPDSPAVSPEMPIPPASDPGASAEQSAPLESLFESDIVTRLDDDHVQFDRAKWIQYEAKPPGDLSLSPAMTLEIERGVYDLKSEILMTNQPVRIENRQFLITGDTMVHDRASGLTRLTGRVKMTFYNEEPEPAQAKTNARPEPVTPGAPPVPSTKKATPAR